MTFVYLNKISICIFLLTSILTKTMSKQFQGLPKKALETRQWIVIFWDSIMAEDFFFIIFFFILPKHVVLDPNFKEQWNLVSHYHFKAYFQMLDLFIQPLTNFIQDYLK